MERDCFTCRHCLDDTKPLNVHHIKYSFDPWDIEDKYLITLCEDCHEFEESIKEFDIYGPLKEVGISKYHAMILIEKVAKRYDAIEHKDFMSWIDTVKFSFNG